MKGNSTLFIILGILLIVIIIAVVKLISKLIEKREINSILEFMKKETKEDKYIKEKFEECMKIIEQNKDKE